MIHKKARVSARKISKWENGKGMPSTDVLLAMSQIFNVSVCEIVCGERINNDDVIDKTNNIILDCMKVGQTEIYRYRMFYVITTFLFMGIMICLLLNYS